MEGRTSRARAIGALSANPETPKVASLAVVIPTMNGANWLERCLQTLTSGTARPAAILVADDGSDDDSADVCARYGATFLVSERGRGSGFAAAVNRGLRAVPERTAWVMLLNNDTEVDPEFVATIMDAGNRHPEAMILAPLVLSLRDRETLDSAGLLLYPDGVARPRWHGERADELELVEEPVLLASGAALVARSEAFRRFGELDESFDSYLEDVDWCLRAARRGAIAMFVPSAVVYHHFSGTIGARSSDKARLVERNRVAVAARHLPLRQLVGSIISTPRRWLVLAKGQRGVEAPGAGRAALIGLVSGIARLPRELRVRRRLINDGSAMGPAWRARLRRHACGPEAFRTFGGE